MTGAGALNRTAEPVPPDLFPISKDLGWLRMAEIRRRPDSPYGCGVMAIMVIAFFDGP